MFNLKDQIGRVLEHYPKLDLIDDKKIRGPIEFLNEENGKLIESFSLELIFPANIARSRLPIVKELSHKIPREKDRHVYADGSFCLMTRIQEVAECKKGLDLIRFIENILRPFLAVQFEVSRGLRDEFPQGEYAHGAEGILQGYFDYLETDNVDVVIQTLQARLSKYPRNQLCYCGSGIKYKKCHFHQVSFLQMLERKEAQKNLEDIREHVSVNMNGN